MRKKPKRDWEDPFYTFVNEKVEITIDVTASIPNFKNPVDGLGDVAAQQFRKRRLTKILDFGAGKLRNTLFLLQKNYQVTAVEFLEAFDSPAANKRLARAKSYSSFTLVEPEHFLDTREAYDAVILVNVVNIVPDDADRGKIVRECAKRLKTGGLMLIMSQHGEPHYEPGVTKRKSLNGGWCYNLHKKHKTYNIEFTLPGLRALVPGLLLKEVRPISSNHHRALLFERV